MDFVMVRAVISLASGRWVLPVLLELANGPLPYARLLRAVNDRTRPDWPTPLSERVLSDTLSRLRDAGLVLHHTAGSPTTTSNYTLPAEAVALLEALHGIEAWTHHHPEAATRVMHLTPQR